jgi:C_GCAxxG_C_C family probable redox protein
MWETTDLGSEDLLWAATNFIGGIASQRECVCGALSGAAVYLGLRHRVPLYNKAQTNKNQNIAREKARDIVLSFIREYGSVICGKLTGIDVYDQAIIQRFHESGEWARKCIGYVQSVIRKLYELEIK